MFFSTLLESIPFQFRLHSLQRLEEGRAGGFPRQVCLVRPHTLDSELRAGV